MNDDDRIIREYLDELNQELFKEEEETKDLRVIDIDFITHLKAIGEHQRAQDLLKAFREDVVKAGKDAVHDVRAKDYRIKKSKGVCTYQGCFAKTNNKATCEKHLKMRREYKNR